MASIIRGTSAVITLDACGADLTASYVRLKLKQADGGAYEWPCVVVDNKVKFSMTAAQTMQLDPRSFLMAQVWTTNGAVIKASNIELIEIVQRLEDVVDFPEAEGIIILDGGRITDY